MNKITTTELYLIAMIIIFTLPYLVWRLARTDYFAPLVVVQIICGILLGPGVLGKVYPDYYKFVFTHDVILSLTGLAWWAVMLFVWIAGIELDLKQTWKHRGESAITSGLALGVPLIFGCFAGYAMLMFDGFVGTKAFAWQFILGVGMACSVTALPILILLMEKLDILRQPIGQRILRYASLDDIAIWGVLALILMDWERTERQVEFLMIFSVTGYCFRKLMVVLPEKDRWPVGILWLALCGFGADWAGLHFMVGAFLAGVIMDTDWFDQKHMDLLRHHLLLTLMPVFFMITGLRTNWEVGGVAVFGAATLLLVASIGGKLIGIKIAGKILNWNSDEASIIGWLLQTKALIMIIFSNILLDRQIISSDTFTALLLMAVVSTMLTVPVGSPMLQKCKSIIFKLK